jgi:hypothetical protein
MLGGFLHICTCNCTIYCGLWLPDNTSCTFITRYQSPGLGLIFWTRNSSVTPAAAPLLRLPDRRCWSCSRPPRLLAVVLRPSSLPLARWSPAPFFFSCSNRSSPLLPDRPPAAPIGIARLQGIGIGSVIAAAARSVPCCPDRPPAARRLARPDRDRARLQGIGPSRPPGPVSHHPASSSAGSEIARC